jgi:hypothetical protein
MYNVISKQQTHKKNDVSNNGINLKKIVQRSLITILPMYFAGEFSHNFEAVFCWVRGGFLWVGLWEVEKLWVRFMGVTLVRSGSTKTDLEIFNNNNIIGWLFRS